MTEQIRRVYVWGGWLRAAHWLLALSVVTLIATAWLMGHSPYLEAAALDVHFFAASVLIFALALRVYLGLAGQRAERFVQLLPSAGERDNVRASLLFFASLGKAPLPKWYSHNPLWKPVYLMWFVLLALSAASGWLMTETPLFAGIYLPTLHSWLAIASSILVGVHVFSVVLHDWKGEAADVSSMINGYRYFTVRKEALLKPEIEEVSIRLDQLGKK